MLNQFSKLATSLRAISKPQLSGVWILFLIATGLRFLYLAFVAQNFDSEQYWIRFADTLYFREVATWFATGSPDLESSLLLVGPGYGYILYIWSMIVGWNAWAHLSLQALISALNCVLIVHLCAKLKLKTNVGLLAGYMHAISLTAITYCCTLYTETWFIFFTLLTLITFLNALQSGSFRYYIVFAAFAYCAAMMRSVGQFYPVVLASIVIAYSVLQRFRKQKNVPIAKPLLAALLALTLISTWPLRNYLKHDVFTISETGTRAARIYWLAAAVAGTYDGNEIKARRAAWDEEMYDKLQTKTPSLSQRHKFDISIIRDTVMKYPTKTMSYYLKNVWDNIRSESNLQHAQTPQFASFWQNLTKRFTSGLGSPLFALTLLGAIILLVSGNKFAGLFLAALYCYLALITGATFWQSSRIFLPGEIVWTPLVSVSIFWGVDFAHKIAAKRGWSPKPRM